MENEKSVERIKKKLIEQKIKQLRIRRNSRYGQFIIQTNDVQSYLISLILLRVVLKSKKLSKHLEGLTLGNLINCFRICARNRVELRLVNSLELYNGKRNALAHKMMDPEKKLTEIGCISSLKLGEELLKKLKELIEINL